MIEALRANPRPRRMSRPLRVSATLLFTGLAVAYLVWKIDLHETAEVLADASPWWFLLAVVIMMLTVIPMAERWRRLLASQGMREHLPWLTRAYFVSYTAGQILPTSIGGDAVRILETSRRHPARLGAISAIVLLERALGGRRPSCSAPSDSCSRSAATTSAPTSGSKAPSCSGRSCSPSSSSLVGPAAASCSAPLLARFGWSVPSAPSTTASTRSGTAPGF